jgi:hypothetical protein
MRPVLADSRSIARDFSFKRRRLLYLSDFELGGYYLVSEQHA